MNVTSIQIKLIALVNEINSFFFLLWKNLYVNAIYEKGNIEFDETFAKIKIAQLKK